MRTKLILFLALLCLLVIGLPASATVDSTPPFAVGWIYTPLSAGLTVKIPIDNNFYLQPLFSVNVYNGNGQTDGAYSLGLRGTMGLPNVDNFYPYIGAGFGHTRSFHGSNVTDSTTDEQRQGFEGFFGMEFRGHLIRPAIEVGIMGLHRSDGSYHIGTSIDFGAYYYL